MFSLNIFAVTELRKQKNSYGNRADNQMLLSSSMCVFALSTCKRRLTH